MDLTPQLFRDVQFTERRGAYDRDEVNAFLARVGTAVGQLQERVREAKQRVDAAEERAARLEAKAGEQDDAKETIQRMLETATRFAAEAEKEARDNAEAIVAQARTKADELIRQAEEAVRRDVGATRDRLEAEIRQLERHRDELKGRIGGLGTHFERERVRLRSQLDELATVLDDPERLVMASPAGDDPEPIIVLTERSSGGTESSTGTESSSGRASSSGTASSTGTASSSGRESASGEPSDTADPGTGAPSEEDLSDLPPPPEDWAPGGPVGQDLEGPPTDAAPALFDDGADDSVGDPHDDAGGPPTQANPVVGPGTAFGGNHLEELRRAVSDDATDPEGDAAMAAFFDQDTDDEPSRRFGRRR